MFIKNVPQIATYTTPGILKPDNETIEVDENGVLSIAPPPAEIVAQSTGSDDEVEAMINDYYAGRLSLEDIKGGWSIGDVRTANSTDKAKFKVASNVAPRVYISNRWQTNYTMPEMTTIKWVIIDFNHSILKETINSISNALITIQMFGMISNGASSSVDYDGNMGMNSSDTNTGGQTGCQLYSYLNGNFYDACGFKSLIKVVKNPTKLNKSSDTLTQCEDKVFLLSEVEIFNTASVSRGGEGTQYKYFETSSNRIKNQGQEGTGSAYAWWERSVRDNNASQFCNVSPYGGVSSTNASYFYGVVPTCAF